MLTGTSLGPYRILDKIGEGAMGEVYRARDAKLGRDVAIKVLPPSFASDTDRRVRFSREARLLASLNHPNIATIHGLEDADGVSALVMELVDGPTLAEKLSRGGPKGTRRGLLLNDALTIARQIADALAAAHERGIVHRDLKPANLKFTESGAVKVLDFGLAKAFTNDDDAGRSQLATTTNAASQLGGIFGTPAYMSPEQARGQAVDARADIWAFGCVLFEMLTARQAFAGETVSDTIAHILERPPDWSALPPTTPSNVRRVLTHCLEKDPNRRWRDIRDVRIELDESDEAVGKANRVSPGSSRWGERAVWSALVLTGVAVAAFVASRGRLAPAPAEIRFDVALPREIAIDFLQPAISPDGQQIVVAPKFVAHEGLWLRSVGSITGRTLPNTQNASFPFWSPDGTSIGFFAETKLKRIDLTSEAVEIVADAPNPRGGLWQSDGQILFAPNAVGPLSRVPAAGGTPAVVTHLEPGQSDHRGPFLLPDGRHVIYYSRGTAQARGVWVAQLDGSEPKRLLDADAAAVYARGHLLFVREGALFAQAFDVASLGLTGAPFRVADRIAVNPGVSLASLSASASGAIAYSGAAIRRTQFVWVDRSGKRLDTLGPPDQTTLANPALSPDGQRLAFSRLAGGNWDVWLMDMHGTMSRLTTGAGPDWNPVWSSDSRRVFFQSNNGTIHVRAIDDSTPEQTLVNPGTMTYPTDVSPDGHTLLYLQGGTTQSSVPGSELWSRSLAGDSQALPFVRNPAIQRDGQFSPDGRWVAYQSNQSGRDEIYLQAFPAPGERIQVSSGGGQQVRWSAAGPELFFIGADRQLMSMRVTFSPNGRPTLGASVPLFRTDFENNFQARQQYLVSKDGQRFLVNMPTDTVDLPTISVILNWKARP
jgi:eukaryotic-like serine/threonine-protein kinase